MHIQERTLKRLARRHAGHQHRRQLVVHGAVGDGQSSQAGCDGFGHQRTERTGLAPPGSRDRAENDVDNVVWIHGLGPKRLRVCWGAKKME